MLLCIVIMVWNTGMLFGNVVKHIQTCTGKLMILTVTESGIYTE
jgi:hypothetical protein